MGGTINVESEPGAGSVFSFSVAFQPSGEHSRRSEVLGGRRALLVAEGSPGREVVQQHLQAAGLKVAVATTPAECLFALRTAAACEAPFDIAIMDGRQNGLDGGALARAVRADSAFERTALMLLVARNADCHLEGVSGAACLSAPLKRKQLLTTVERLLNRDTRELRNTPEPAGKESAPSARILVAEDNPINQKFIRLVLERLGHRVEMASNGIEAVRAVQLVPCEVVLMDCQMPEMDGYEAARQIRSSQLSRQPVIIAITANAIAGERERCLEAGMDDYISKPVRPEQLSEKLDLWLRRPPAEAGEQAGPLANIESIWRTEDERQHLTRLVADIGSEDVREMLANFAAHSARGLQELSSAVEGNELGTVAAIAHNLRGGCGIVGLLSAERVLAGIERQARSNDSASCTETVRDFQQTFAPILQQLRPAAEPSRM
jgi:CheY-like chemotaxis protein